MPEYSNVPELAYDWMIVTYFFLGGLSAGVFLFSVATTYWSTDLRALGKRPAFLAPIILAVGMLILLIDQGQPFRGWRIYVFLNTTSALSWGVWFLHIFLALSVLYAWHLYKSGPDKAKTFGYLGVPLALLVATYTGVLLTESPGRPLWHTSLVPVLFLNGAVISGIALGLLLSHGQRGDASLGGVGKLLGGLVLCELALLVLEIFSLSNGLGEEVVVANALLTGSFAPLFLGVEILLGMLVPAVLLFRSKAPVVQVIASVLVLVGVFTMRYVVVIGGQVIGG